MGLDVAEDAGLSIDGDKDAKIGGMKMRIVLARMIYRNARLACIESLN